MYTIIPDAPRSRSGDLYALGASHAADGVIGLVNYSNPQFGPYHGTTTYGHQYGGTSTSYVPSPIGYPSMPYNYPNPPSDTSRSNSHAGASTSYSGPPVHNHVHGHSGNSSSGSGASTSYVAPHHQNTYYPFLGPPPAPPAPQVATPQSQVNAIQATPPQQGQVYAQQNVPNPPNKKRLGL